MGSSQWEGERHGLLKNGGGSAARFFCAFLPYAGSSWGAKIKLTWMDVRGVRWTPEEIERVCYGRVLLIREKLI